MVTGFIWKRRKVWHFTDFVNNFNQLLIFYHVKKVFTALIFTVAANPKSYEQKKGVTFYFGIRYNSGNKWDWAQDAIPPATGLISDQQ